MYINQFWLIVAALWIAYLLWRIWKLKSISQQILNIFDEYESKMLGLSKGLCDILIYHDALFLRKASQKTRKKILEEQANDLRITFENNTLKEFWVNGKLERTAGPMDLLSRSLNSPVEESDDYRETNEDIADSLDTRIEEVELD